MPIAACCAYWAGGEVGIQIWDSVAVAAVVRLPVLIITVGTVVSPVLLVGLIYSRNVFLVCLRSDLVHCGKCVRFKDCWIDTCKRCDVWLWWFGRWYDLLELPVPGVADEQFTGIIILAGTCVMMAAGFATTSARIVFAICMWEVAQEGLVFRHIGSVSRHGKVIAGNSVRWSR